MQLSVLKTNGNILYQIQKRNDCVFVITALKIHISGDIYQWLSATGLYKMEYRGLMDIKVAIDEVTFCLWNINSKIGSFENDKS